jgi:23S rRNA (cytidine1920-2'-O)/16S rRNA (cytidine1409-2'-O)-methyltransferase
VNLEGTDARNLDATRIPEPPGLIVTDLSFISLTKALGPALALAGEGAHLIALVKPQFEQESRSQIGKGGLVTDTAARQAALDKVSTWLEEQGWRVRETVESPVIGGDGNREWLLWATL